MSPVPKVELNSMVSRERVGQRPRYAVATAHDVSPQTQGGHNRTPVPRLYLFVCGRGRRFGESEDASISNGGCKMTRAKALLLGSVVGFFAASVAQAADLPAKAKPVQYVKICTLYGEGYYYIPGSDTCIRFGGYIRAQYGWNAGNNTLGGGIVPGTTLTATDGLRNRSSSEYSSAHRADVIIDTRTQTQYGTLRTHMDWRAENRGGDVQNLTRAFIQWAGFTFGRARSFFDLFTHDQRLAYLNVRTTGDTSDLGLNLAAYSWQVGNGVTASLSFEDPNRNPVVPVVVDGTSAAFTTNAAVTSDSAGIRHPDIVGNLRYDQNWGYVGVSAAAHANRGQYYLTPSLSSNPHPPDKWGWAAAVGGEVNLPWGDTIGANFVYSLGASAYATRSGSWQLYNSNSVGVGWLVDGVFDTGTAIELTRVWSINSAYQHRWTQNWATSLYGGYVKVDYNAAATTIINSHLPGAAGTTPCGVPVAGAVWPPTNIPVGSGNSCTPDFSYLQVGTRTQWTPVSGLDIGLDVFYTKLFSAYKGANPAAGGIYGPVSTRPAVNVIEDADVWSAIFRVQRTFNAGD